MSEKIRHLFDGFELAQAIIADDFAPALCGANVKVLREEVGQKNNRNMCGLCMDRRGDFPINSSSLTWTGLLENIVESFVTPAPSQYNYHMILPERPPGKSFNIKLGNDSKDWD